jgi:peptide/nickel transport system substrate-binding protein
MWNEAGFEVAIEPIEQAALISTAIGGDYQTISWRNHPGGDPDTQYIWWYGGSPLNFGNIDDPEINALLDEGRSSLDEQRRQEVYEEINREFGAEAYNQWINWVRWSIASATGVEGVPGPQLPDGSQPFTGLAPGHSVAGLWRSGG